MLPGARDRRPGRLGVLWLCRSRSPRSNLGGAVCDLASFLGQLQCRTLPLVGAQRMGPVDVGVGDAAERGDGVTRTPASYGARRVHDRDSCVRLAGRFIGPGERALDASFAIAGLLDGNARWWVLLRAS